MSLLADWKTAKMKFEAKAKRLPRLTKLLHCKVLEASPVSVEVELASPGLTD